MKHRKIISFFIFCIGMVAVLQADIALAIFDVQALYGKRWYETKTNDEKYTISAKEATLAVHISPLSGVPLAIGLSYSLFDYDMDEVWGDPSSNSGHEINLDLMVWVPVGPIITPYVKFKYTLTSEMTAKYNDPYEIKYKINGFHIDIGLKYKLIPSLSVMIEGGQGIQMIKMTKFLDENVDGSWDDFNSKGVQIGLEFNI